jgi:hypothetical protein
MSRRKAEKLFEEFHQFEPVDVGNFHRSFRIPHQANYVGEAKKMFYASDKLNPETSEDEGWIHYFHDHMGGVRLYLIGDVGGEIRPVPKWIYNTRALTRLGDCEGFEYIDFDDELVKAEGTNPLPEWYAVPSGKALLVVQGKRTVLAILWGGKLDVEERGVVG